MADVICGGVINGMASNFFCLYFSIHVSFYQANLIRTAAANYLLDAGVQWGAAPAVKVGIGATIASLLLKILET